MVFEEHEVNEDIQPVTAFESEKEIELPKEVPEKLPEAGAQLQRPTGSKGRPWFKHRNPLDSPTAFLLSED
ncbi:hypothetical protein P7K49_029720, partial [Saguinus oedipus]